MSAEKLYVPKGIPNFHKFGQYDDILRIIASEKYLPVFITGLARSGKTCAVEQACHDAERELIRVNFNEDTSEDDLIGGFRLMDGNTVWFDGPVAVAMERGAVLLLDEVDLASHKIMCLQPILEGSSLYLKKVGRVVDPKPGFNVFATANTKGQGDIRGKFVGTNILNESFLDRFSITIEHEYPPPDVEKKILQSYIGKTNDPSLSSSVVSHLVDWAVAIRRQYSEERSSDVVSTGRLIHIIRAYTIFGNPFKAVKLGIARFDDNMKDVFFELFKKNCEFEEEDFEDMLSSGGSRKKFFEKALNTMDMSGITAGKKSKRSN